MRRLQSELSKLLFRDLSTGGLIRQHRETTYGRDFVAKRSPTKTPTAKGQTKIMKSAFDEGGQYELTALGEQFVHYAMTDVPPTKFKNAGDYSPFT
jgi:hypothetical protein